MARREKERVFRMKQFEVNHTVSANKVGVDGVLVGAWAAAGEARRVLDAGCGCGLISLMLAQRMPDARIIGIDIEDGAVEEARRNADASPWGERIKIRRCDFAELEDLCGKADCTVEKFDLIVSNPPFFSAGVEATESARMLARHAGTLSPERLLRSGSLLQDAGRLAFIAIAEDEERLKRIGEEERLKLRRLTRVKGNPQTRPKRILMEWQKCVQGEVGNAPMEVDELVIEYAPGDYTPEYVRLCRDFYLKF